MLDYYEKKRRATIGIEDMLKRRTPLEIIKIRIAKDWGFTGKFVEKQVAMILEAEKALKKLKRR